ncbi:hypothetical protein LQZ18_18235 [Lachnospiraceae bacterium ZAX-1]
MKTLKAKITFIEPILGTSPTDPEIYESYIGNNAPDAPSLSEEIEAVGREEVIEKGMTVFPRNENGKPMLWDYQVKGFLKDACGVLGRVKAGEGKTLSSSIKAYKKIIDGLIFVFPRQIEINTDKEITTCQRPLRAQTAQGERIALAMSEEIAQGATIDIEIRMLDGAHEPIVKEWLDYGVLRGIGQWRNSGKGRFTWEEIKD